MASLIDDSGTTRFEGTITGASSDRIFGADDAGGATGSRAIAHAAGALVGGALLVQAGDSIAGQVGGAVTVQGGQGDAGGSGGASLGLGGGQTGATQGDAVVSADRFSVSVVRLGFYTAAPVAQQTGVAVNAGAIHAALVNLGLITA